MPPLSLCFPYLTLDCSCCSHACRRCRLAQTPCSCVTCSRWSKAPLSQAAHHPPLPSQLHRLKPRPHPSSVPPRHPRAPPPRALPLAADHRRPGAGGGARCRGGRGRSRRSIGRSRKGDGNVERWLLHLTLLQLEELRRRRRPRSVCSPARSRDTLTSTVHSVSQ